MLAPSERDLQKRTPSGLTRALARPRALSPRAVLAWALPAFFVALPVVLIAITFWPGHMSADTLDEAFQASSGQINNQHAAILVEGWHLLWPLGVGPGYLFFGQLVCFAVGIFLILRAVFKPLAAGVITAVIAFVPPVLGFVAVVGRDMWFLGFLLLAFGLLIRAAQRPWPARGWWLGASVVFGWLSLAARQNAVTCVVVVIVGVMALVLARRWPQPAQSRGQRIKRGLAVGAAGIAVTLVMLGSQAGLSSALGVKNNHPEQYLFIYDLSALTQREHKDLIPTSVVPRSKARDVEQRFGMDDVVSVTFVPDAPFSVPVTAAQDSSLRKRWLHVITTQPFSYLRLRGQLFLRQIGITRRPIWVWHPQIDPNSFGYQSHFPSLDKVGGDYMRAFTEPNNDGSYIFRPWIYLLVALVGAIILLRRRWGPALILAGGVALAALTLQIGYFFGAMAVGYRWEHPAVVMSLITLAILLRLAVTRLRHRPAG